MMPRGPKPSAALKAKWDAQPLGRVNDQVIADALGCSRSYVQQQRKARGIPRHDPYGHIDWDSVALGTKSDTALGEQLDCPADRVATERRRRKIAVFRSSSNIVRPDDWKCRGRGIWLAKTERGDIIVVDEIDLALVRRHHWSVSRQKNSCYVTTAIRRDGKNRWGLMHRMILRVKSRSVEVDHVDGNGLNNRRKNLRRVTHSQNQQNRKKSDGKQSQYKGVFRRGNRWHAGIKLKKKQRSLGWFASEEEAARAYDEEARRLFGEFAYVNFPTHEEKRRRR